MIKPAKDWDDLECKVRLNSVAREKTKKNAIMDYDVTHTNGKILMLLSATPNWYPVRDLNASIGRMVQCVLCDN